jgi:quercetin dioxygenase-like cupin family protein
MKNTRFLTRLHGIGCAVVVSSCVVAFQCTSAAELKEARVTYMVNDVALLLPQAPPRLAALSDQVRDGTAVRTGSASRSELTFTDLTITRLGANTIFSFNEGTRNLDLKEGAILLRVPKNLGGAKITTAAVTAAITGTTVMMEYHPHGFIKAIGLEGTFRVYLKKRLGESVLVHAGQMIIMRADATRLPDPVDVDLKQLLKTSLLITGFPPLPSAGLIAQAMQTQTGEKASGQLVETNLVIFGSGTVLSLLDQTNIDQISQATVAQAALAPKKFGPPATIISFNPYPITNTTVITTDPTITTNGVTDSGKIYRGPVDDGAFTNFAFGSTSAFDLATQINGLLADSANLPIAVFKFQSLSLLGNPTISLGNGGPTKLFLVAENGINSGPPGGTLTFSGLDTLALATVAGSINLTADISFQNLPLLFIYARGAGSNLNLSSPITGSNEVFLNAEGLMRLLVGITTTDQLKFISGSDLIAAAPGGIEFKIDNISKALGQGGDILVQASGNFSAQNLSLLIDDSAGGQINAGGNISVTTGGDFGILGGANFTIQNMTGTIGGGGNITLTVGGSISTSGRISLLVDNSNGGMIGTGGNIFVTTGSDLTADSISAFINNRNGGSIGSADNLTFNIGGTLITQQDAQTGENAGESLFLLISNRNDGSGGGTIGGDVALNLDAASVSVGGNMLAAISTNGGGHAPRATLDINISGDLTVQGNTADANTFGVLEGADLEVQNFSGGTIDTDATVNLRANNVFGNIELAIRNGGTIGSNATINANVASISSFSPGDGFGAVIQNNPTSTIVGNAIIDVSVSGNINTDSVGFSIVQSFGGGTIGGDATINISAANITANSLVAQIFNSGGASIGGNAAINMNVSGKTNVTNDADVEILGSDSAAAAAININGGSYNVGGTFLSEIDGSGTMAFKNASVAASVLQAGVLGTNGVLNIGGGTLSADTILKLYAPGSNGQLNFVSNVTLGGLGTKILAANSVTIFNNVVVTVAGDVPVDVFTNNPNYSGQSGGNGSTTGTFAGAGANTPQPLASAPPFADPPPAHHASTTLTTRKTARPAINISNTDQLLSLLDGAAANSGGKITIPSPWSTTHWKHSSRVEAAGRLQGDHNATDTRSERPLL